MARRLVPGEDLEGIPADSWNQFADAADFVSGLRHPFNAPEVERRPPAGLTIKAILDADRKQFEVVGIDEPQFTIAEDAEAPYRGPPGVKTVAPTAGERFAILQRGGVSGQDPPAVLVGASWVKVDIQDADDTTAGAITGDATKLISGTTGCDILWKESGTGLKWCLVLLGGGSGGGGNDQGVGLITTTIAAATYTDSTNTLSSPTVDLRIFKEDTVSSDGDMKCLTKVTGYWAGDETVSVSIGKARLCYWHKINGNYFVRPGCNEFDFDESSPAITTSASQSINENTTAVVTMAGTDIDTDAEWSIIGGADASFFTIDADTGALAFQNAPDYEDPQDADTNNIYVVDVQVENCDGETASLSIGVTVNNVAE